MRINRLTIAGFGPYKNEQHINFDHFADEGLFLMTGKTGAGKSSILDAICFALYGSIPRFQGTQQRLRSDHCDRDDPSFVELEFTVGEREYRVHRTPEYDRLKARGAGYVSRKPTATLAVRNGDGWEGLAARPVDVAHELTGIVGLTKDQFLQVILLAQNRFQEFLLAKNEARQEILRTLFGTRRFASIETMLVDRRKELDAHLAGARDTLQEQAIRAASLANCNEIPGEPSLEWFSETLDALRQEYGQAVAQATQADAVFSAADRAHRNLESVRQLQARRDDAVAQLAALHEQGAARSADRRTLEAAGRAAIVWAQIVVKREAASALQSAISAEAEAREKYDGEIADLGSHIRSLTKKWGTLEAVLADEGTLPALLIEIEALQQQLDECDQSLAQAMTRTAELPSLLDALAARLSDARVLAAGESNASDRLERLKAARKAALVAGDLQRQHSEALAQETTAAGIHAAAAAQVHRLMQQRLAGYAAELANNLVEGEPCAVCGSERHPMAARGEAAAVTGEDVDRAREETDTSKATVDTARAKTQNLATKMAEALARAENRGADELEVEITDAESVLDAVRRARDEATSLTAEQIVLKEQLTSAAAAIGELREARDESAKRLAGKVREHGMLIERIEKHREEYETVTARAKRLQIDLHLANQLLEAVSHMRLQEKSVHRASAALAEQLTEQGFSGEDVAVAARRTRVETAQLEAQLKQYDEGVAAAKATLADAHLADLTEEPVDLVPSETAVAVASEARDAAVSARSSLAARCEQLQKVVVSAHAEHAASADLRQQHSQLRELANVVQGNEPNEKRMRLETFVLAARLEEIVAAANARLRTMTGGRYALEHDDAVQFRRVQSGLGLAIRDEHTGRARATQSLSGGEMFLASLALALGLAEVVTNQAGGITLDTLFIDEGFGSLDSDTLEVAMSTLDSLRAGGRTIGLISHVDAMKEQITAKLKIAVTAEGYSEIAAIREPA